MARKAYVNTAETTEATTSTTKKYKFQALQFTFKVNWIFRKSPAGKMGNEPLPPFLFFYFYLFFRRFYVFPLVCPIGNLTLLYQQDQIYF